MWFSFNSYLNFLYAVENAVEDPVGKPLICMFSLGKYCPIHLCVRYFVRN